MHVYEALNTILAEEGIDQVFTLMSDATMGLVSDLEKAWSDEIGVIHTRHEQGAVAMADGYHRSTGDIGVAVLGKGPALAHTGTALINARKKGSKVLVIVADEPHSKYYDNPVKRFRQEPYLNVTLGGLDRSRYDTSDTVITLRSTDDLVTEFTDAIRRIRTDVRPVAVQIPSDLLNDTAEIDQQWDEYVKTVDTIPSKTPPLHPDQESIAEAVDLYLDSDATKAPVIVAGRGAVNANAKDAIVQLAERMNAFLVTTMQARGFFGAHPYALGTIGTHGHFMANQHLVDADYIIAVGCSLNEFTTDKNHLLGGDPDLGKIVQIDTDPGTIGRYTPAEVGIVADGKSAIEAIEKELAASDIHREDQFWTERMREQIAEPPEFLQPENFETDPDYIDPRAVITRVNEFMARDRLVVVESGHSKIWVLKGIHIPNAGDFVWSLDFSSIGQATPIGIGAAAGEKDRTTYAFCGDAGFMMSLPEVETAVRHDIPIVITVNNDSALGSEYHRLVKDGAYADSAVIETPDLGAVARELGADGYTVRNTDDLEELAEVYRDPAGPVVVDCKVIRDVEVEYSGQ